MKLISLLAGKDSSRLGFRAGGGSGYFQPLFWTLGAPTESIEANFESYVLDCYQSNGVVYACIAARAMVFSQARFLWRRMRNGRPSELFGNQDLALIEKPWVNASTGDLLTRMEQDVSLAGNFYGVKLEDEYGPRIQRLRPDWVIVVSGSPTEDPNDYRTRIIGYQYAPPGWTREAMIFDPADVIHYTEMLDPLARWRGMSWLTPVLREVQADKEATEHKLAYFKHGAKASIAIRYDASIGKEAFQAFVEMFREQHEKGSQSAYRALHLGGGADVTPLTANLKDLDFKSTQGAGESRIAAASGAHPVIVPLTEGLQGSSLNAGNFQAARRLFVDGRIRWLWSKASSALGSILPTPEGAHLWYDDRDIPFLRQDAKEEAEVLQMHANAIRALLDSGFDPDEAVNAVISGDLRRLVGMHSGLFSVQLQAPGEGQSAPLGGTL